MIWSARIVKSAMREMPISFTFGGQTWTPTIQDLQLTYDVNTTVNNAYSIGRTNDFWRNLFDRLPFSRRFIVALITNYGPQQKALTAQWIDEHLVRPLERPMENAWLTISDDQVAVERSQTGRVVDAAAALNDVSAAMGSLTVHRVRVPVVAVIPGISDAAASADAARIQRFLDNPPTLRLQSDEIHTDGATLASMISFGTRPTGQAVNITMKIRRPLLQEYVDGLVAAYQVPAQAPQVQFNGANVVVIRARPGRVVNASYAEAQLLKAFTGLKPHTTIKVPVRAVAPVVGKNNPAVLGITTLLGQAQTSLVGSPPARLADVENIATHLNRILIRPGAQISLNYLVGLGLPPGTAWPDSTYEDTGTTLNGQVVPDSGGGMQQVATTLFRAGYAAGLQVLERHSHSVNLPWYDPPIGMDAIVSPSGQDLRFRNTTGGYLWIQSSVDPVNQTLNIYIYGRSTGWTVTLSPPHIGHRYPPGPALVEQDPSLAVGQRRYQQYAIQGADVVVSRTLNRPGFTPSLVTTTLFTHYQPQRAIILEGSKGNPQIVNPTPTPLPTPAPSRTPAPTSTTTSTVTTTPTVTPSPTPTTTATP